MADATARRMLAPEPGKRPRLIGPPPAFEMNMLQHLQETRGKLEDSPHHESNVSANDARQDAPTDDPISVLPALYDRFSASANASDSDATLSINKRL
ncbi:MAG: hypothetical protein ACK4NW_06745 [Roseinatronobacter sp.]